MIKIGTVVEATVIKIATFGIYLQHQGDVIFTPLGNVSWPPSPDTLLQFELGQDVRILVERFNYEKKEYSGNLRALVPELNPYREFANLPAGNVLTGRVQMVHQNGATVELNEWCLGELPYAEGACEIVEGEVVEVQITSLELSDQRMTLKLFGSD